jgi:hypothetical protein
MTYKVSMGYHMSYRKISEEKVQNKKAGGHN